MAHQKADSQINFVSFSAGEMSPKMGARIDIEQYGNGLRKCENAIISKTGGLSRRPGMEFIAEASESTVSPGVTKNRLIPFVFSRDETYILELVPHGLYVHGSGAASPFFVESEDNGAKWGATGPDFDEDEHFEIQYAQINDVMYFTHPKMPPHKLVRLSDTSWVLLTNFFDDLLKKQDLKRFNGLPPMLDENITDDTITITNVAAVAGEPYSTCDLEFTPDLITNNHLHSFWRVGFRKEAVSIKHQLTSNGTSSEVLISGPWNFRTTGSWNVEILLQRREVGETDWETLRKFIGTEDRNIDISGEEKTGAFFRIKTENHIASTGTPRAYLDAPSHIAWSYVLITNIVDQSLGTAEGIIFRRAATVNSGVATTYWNEGAWSKVRGYPAAVSFFENRLVFGGSGHQPQTVWASEVNGFEQFELGNDDDDSYAFTFAASERNAIVWMVSHRALMIGTSGGEWELSAGREDQIVTPTNVRIRKRLYYGSDPVQPFATNDVILFVERQGKRLRELAFAFERDGWVAPDMTLLADHIAGEGIVQLALQRTPETIIWAVNKDGELIGMTYERAQNVNAWHRHSTTWPVASVAVLPAPGQDEIWVIVDRGSSGSPDYKVERITPDPFALPEWTGTGSAPATDKIARSFFLDSGKSYFGDSTDSFSGMEHLAGRTVQALADGVHYSSVSIDGSGNFTLPAAAELVHVGLNYRMIFETLRIDRDPNIGITIGLKKDVREVIVRLLDSYGLQWDNDSPPFKDVPFDSLELFDGDKVIPWRDNPVRDPRIILRKTDPYPLTLLALIVKYQLTDR